jgi:D-glycero-alpha-D-manno-heptose-7-phosphate kinase
MNKFVVAKTPMRITLFGGGTDYYDYFKTYGGETLGSSINFYSYVIVKKLSIFDNFNFRITYTKKEQVKSYKHITHPVFKAAIKYTNLINERLEILHFSDLPSFSGIGSSSAFIISLLNALYNYKGIKITKEELANKAIYFERTILNEEGGYQDQLTCTYGGICNFHYSKKKITKKKINKEKEIENLINSNFLLLYSNISRDGTKIARKQKKIDKQKLTTHFQLLVKKSLKIMNLKNLHELGILLDKSWKDKKKLAHTSNKKIDKIYADALRHGAIGGKLLGAGGGGFFLFLVLKKKQNFFKKKMKNFKISNFKVDNYGATVKKFKNLI